MADQLPELAPAPTPVPDLLRTAIAARGVTQAAFARCIGVKPQALQEWLTGRRPVPPARAGAIEHLTAGAIRAEQLCDGFEFERDAQGAVVGYRVRIAPPTTNAEAA